MGRNADAPLKQTAKTINTQSTPVPPRDSSQTSLIIYGVTLEELWACSTKQDGAVTGAVPIVLMDAMESRMTCISVPKASRYESFLGYQLDNPNGAGFSFPGFSFPLVSKVNQFVRL